MSTVEYEALTTLSEDLCNALPINDLFPSLISKRVIDFNDKAEICSDSIERRRVELFISKLKSGDSEKFYKFMEVMKKSPKCVDLLNRMEQFITMTANPRANCNQRKTAGHFNSHQVCTVTI